VTTATVAVVVPTIEGREELLNGCLDAYGETCPSFVDLNLIVVRDKPTCGIAWQEGAEIAVAEGCDYLHFSADDLEPLGGWVEAALWMADQGRAIPAPRLVGRSGVLQSCGDPARAIEMSNGTEVQFSAVPFLRREWWTDYVDPMLPTHYYTDNWVSFKARLLGGVPSVVARDYSFIHHFAEPGRGAGMSYEARMANDHAAYVKAAREVQT
jgi:hypothetical protein